ncbi:uncharacterized protein KY384_005138 [Bacidia gigantensis]|uniref:uncharacterized protein n=1 Tax=Bacidia gigantensis TaxID=2732470 RepID=UPI001D0597AC|nr:uncharacterized protein KY384_005138 [Bacidia gigantensis]KAG8529657.1 hypothetical protein KY384_005138 [Bacidia gigantensis]
MESTAPTTDTIPVESRQEKVYVEKPGLTAIAEPLKLFKLLNLRAWLERWHSRTGFFNTRCDDLESSKHHTAEETLSDMTTPGAGGGLVQPEHSEFDRENIQRIRRKEVREAYPRHVDVLGRLKVCRNWSKHDEPSLYKALLISLGIRRRPIPPSIKEVIELACFFFPRRPHLRASICDFGENDCQRYEVFLKDIREYSVKCRWIHVPSAWNAYTDTIKASFLECESGIVKSQDTKHAFVTNSLNVLSVRRMDYIKDQLDVYNILIGCVGLHPYLNDLDHLVLSPDSKDSFPGRFKATYWQSVWTDIPAQLADIFPSNDFDALPSSPVMHSPGRVTSHAYFGRFLVCDTYSSWSRKDGSNSVSSRRQQD